MGLFKNFVRKAIGTAGRYIGNMANAATGGTAGIAGKWLLNKAHDHAGTIGKVARGLGQQFLSKETRDKLSSAADTALKYLPGGKIKDTLSKINDAAQGRKATSQKPPTLKSSKATVAAGEGNVYNNNAVRSVNRAVPLQD